MLLISFGLKKGSLTLLLTLEILLLVIIMITVRIGLDLFFRLLMVCIGACEGALGLGALICISRVNRFIEHYV